MIVITQYTDWEKNVCRINRIQAIVIHDVVLVPVSVESYSESVLVIPVSNWSHFCEDDYIWIIYNHLKRGGHSLIDLCACHVIQGVQLLPLDLYE